MNKKQYNNVIEHTLKYEQTEDSLATARAIFDNMGVALPQGDIKTVYETIKTDNYMGWKSCTMQEAQSAAENGIAAIGISEDRIVVLSANDDEQPVTQTASVMTLDKNTSAFAVDGLRYYSYSYGTTTETTETTTENRVFNSNYLINQANLNIMYPYGEQPGDESRAFADPLFLRTVCGKSGATGTIKASGCGICCLAMHALYKSDWINTNINQYNAVKAAAVHGTTNAADLKYNSSFSFGGESITVTSTNDPDNALSNGNCCIFYIAPKHFVLVYGIDSQQTGTSKYLVADPDGGKLRTLTEAMTRRNVSASMSNITVKLVVK